MTVWGATRDENGGPLRYAIFDALHAMRSARVWCCEPVTEFGPGVPRHHPLLRLRAARTAESVSRRTPHAAVVDGGGSMEVLDPRCCGLDVHKKTVVACVLISTGQGKPYQAIRTFSTMTADLLALAAWLTSHGVTHVAMESTGVYWKPIYNLLERSFTLLLVNAQHSKAVPGRKTDVRDCAWIADRLRHGLLRGSFVPDAPQRELRDLTRYRAALVHERRREGNRLQKTLEGANIKLASVASDILGASGRAMLAELVAGTTDAALLADLAKGKLRDKLPQLEQALTGRFGDHQRLLVARQLAHLDDLEATIAQVSGEVAARLRPFEVTLVRWDAIPGVGQRTAEAVLAEIGTDMGRFPTSDHLVSWAGMCPGNDESAGKRKRSKTRTGNAWLRAALIEAAHAAGRTKGTSLGAQYQRLAARRGTKRAAVAVGAQILRIMYHVVKEDQEYEERGGRELDDRERAAIERRLVKRLEALGNRVVLEPTAQAA